MKTNIDLKFKENLNWEKKAQINPLFAVMSHENFKTKSQKVSDWTKKDLELFFIKGQRIFDFFLFPIIRRLNLTKDTAYIVEYGSGMGRVLKAIYKSGYKCAGIDISPTMLKNSRKIVPEINDLYVLNKDGRCKIKDNVADIVFSWAVLQHVSKLSQVRIAISEMCRILKPGGVLKIQYYSPDNPIDPLTNDQYISVVNHEDYTIHRPILPDVLKNTILKVMKYTRPNKITHTNWLGVPISYKNIIKFLKENKVKVKGFEKDISHNNWVWVTGEKEK
jgi:SAM-dependent methyltransferase